MQKLARWLILGLFVLAVLSTVFWFIESESKSVIKVGITEIVDVESGEYLRGDVYVNGELVAQDVESGLFVVTVPGKIEVIGQGYQPWKIALDGRTERILSGPVRLHRVNRIDL